VLQLVRALKNITAFLRRNQKATVRWSSIRSRHRLKRTSGTSAGFARKHCASFRLEQTRKEKTQLAMSCSHGAIGIQVLYGSTYHLLPTEAGPATFCPFMSVVVTSSLGRL